MDLGLAGRRAIICGASQGLGLACARAFAAEGTELLLVARDAAKLQRAAASIRSAQPAAVVAILACDLTDAAAPEAILASCPAPDILVVNSGGPPPGPLRQFGRAEWEAALNANLISAVMLIRALIDGMCARGFGRVVTITSGAVKAPLPFLALSNAARTGLASAVKGLAAEVAARNVTLNNLMPGPFDTERLAGNFRRRAELSGQQEVEIRAESLAKIPAGRFGHPDEFAALCVSLCNARLGYLTGQSILIDGGAYPGLL